MPTSSPGRRKGNRGDPFVGHGQPSQLAGARTLKLWLGGQDALAQVPPSRTRFLVRAPRTGRTGHTSCPEGLQWREERSGKASSSPAAQKSGGAGAQAQGAEELGSRPSLGNGGEVGGGIEAKGKEAGGTPSRLEKAKHAGLERPGLAARNCHVGETIEERDWGGGGGDPFPGELLSLGPRWLCSPNGQVS